MAFLPVRIPSRIVALGGALETEGPPLEEEGQGPGRPPALKQLNVKVHTYIVIIKCSGRIRFYDIFFNEKDTFIKSYDYD